MAIDVTERPAVNKRPKTYPRPVADLLNRCLGDVFARQGFASADIVTHWPEIVGPEIAAHAEPMKLNWPRGGEEEAAPATLVLRVEGPAAIEIQHLAAVFLAGLIRSCAWRAAPRLALRRAPLAGRPKVRPPPAPPRGARARVPPRLPEIADEGLRAALARLGAAIKPP